MRKQEHPGSFDVPFLTRQLIAYIGNKRRLLPFLAEIFEDHRRPVGVTEFVDPFAGSGAVARLARLLGYRVAAADREEYAAVVCRAALTPTRWQADALLERFGGLERAIHALNEIGSAAANEKASSPGYIERNYAPRTTEDADYRTERLFYTTENARFLDAVRDTVETWLPPLPGRG
ncbi:MAG: DNA adenine methylase, partial [Spirochaetia bacterium]